MVKKIATTMLVLSVSAFAAVLDCTYLDNVEDLKQLTSKDAACAAKIMADEMNKETPIQVDKYTKISTLSATDKQIVFKYSTTIDKTEKNLSMDKMKKLMQKAITNSNCTVPEIRHLLNIDVYVKHQYYDKNNLFMFDFDVDKATCLKNNFN